MVNILKKIPAKHYNENSGKIETVKEITVYNADDNSMPASKWAREPLNKINYEIVPGIVLKSAINVSEKQNKGKNYLNAIGCFYNHCNDVCHNAQTVILFSGGFTDGGCLPIYHENFRRVVSLFAARRLIQNTWLNNSNEYLTPNTEHPDYEQWVNDSIIFSLFSSKSQQSSLRSVQSYSMNKPGNLFNQFFFMSNNEISKLANTSGYSPLYQDAKKFNTDRYVYNTLSGIKLSNDAQSILNFARELTGCSIKFREHADEKFHLDAWDAGWYQIRKGLLEVHMKDEIKQFAEQFNKFSKRMTEGVYKFKFLID